MVFNIMRKIKEKEEKELGDAWALVLFPMPPMTLMCNLH